MTKKADELNGFAFRKRARRMQQPFCQRLERIATRFQIGLGAVSTPTRHPALPPLRTPASFRAMGKGQRSARRQLQERTDRAGPSSDASGAGCSGSVAGKHVDAPEAVGHGTSIPGRNDGHAGTQHAAHPHPRPATGSLHAHAAAGGREHAAAGAASVQPCPAAAPVLNQQQCEALRQAILRGDDSTVIQVRGQPIVRGDTDCDRLAAFQG